MVALLDYYWAARSEIVWVDGMVVRRVVVWDYWAGKLVDLKDVSRVDVRDAQKEYGRVV